MADIGTGKRLLLLIFAAIVLVAGVNVVHPHRIPWVGDWEYYVETRAVERGVDLVQLSEMIEMLRSKDRVLVDARSSEDYSRGHIPGALSVPYEPIAEGAPVPNLLLESDQPLVFYCSGKACEDSLLLALAVREQGRAQVAVFTGGIALWEAEMLAVREGDTP